MSASKQIKTYPYTSENKAIVPLASKSSYECANAFITRGLTGVPSSLEDCLNRFPTAKKMAEMLGVEELWLSPKSPDDSTELKPGDKIDLLTGIISTECQNIENDLGSDWLGCLWGSPQAPFSCTCPEVGKKFKAYLKHRLNVATFWKTPKSVPVFRQSFLDYLKYQTKIEITVAGNFDIRPGNLLDLNVESFKTKAPFSVSPSHFSGLYIVIAVRHVINNGGSHETSVTLSYIPTATDV